jgi:hypothetical protein
MLVHLWINSKNEEAKMKRVMIITLTCLLAVSGIGFAKGLGGIGILKMPRDKWWQIPKGAEKLELTGEKQQELDDLFVHNQRRMMDLRNDVQKVKREGHCDCVSCGIVFPCTAPSSGFPHHDNEDKSANKTPHMSKPGYTALCL